MSGEGLQQFLEFEGEEAHSGPIEDAPAGDSNTETPAGESEESTAEATPVETQAEEPSSEKGPNGEPVPKWQREAVAQQRERRRAAEDKAAAAEREVAYLKGRIEAHQAAKAPPEEDADGKFFDAPVETMKQTLAESKWETLVMVTQAVMRGAHEDYDEVEGKFLELASKDDSLKTQLYQQKDPARFAYNYMKQKEQAAQFKSPEDMEQAIRKKILAEMEAETRGKKADEAAASVPSTQAGAPGSGTTSASTQVDTDPAHFLPTREFNS